MDTLTADALRIAIQNLDRTISAARICIRKSDARLPGFLAEYRRLVRVVFELQEKRQAESNIVQPICMAFLPMPFNQQIMGLSALSPSERIRREWAGFRAPTITNTAPRALQAA